MSEAIKSGMCGRCLAWILLLWLKKKIFYRLFRWFIPDVISHMLVNISVGKLSLRND